MIDPRKSTANENGGDQVGTASAKKETRVKVAGWPGYVRGGVFVIEKKIGGVKFHRSTHATTLRGALKQLERFEADPGAYSARGSPAVAPLVLDAAMVDEFFLWHSASVSRPWALNVRSLLVAWANDFKGKDLRALSLMDDLKPHLRKHPAQAHHRAKAIRILFGWLRTEKGTITRGQDVSLDLPIPVMRPAHEHAPHKAVPFDVVVAAAAHLPVHVRDVLELLAATGWHVAEARRFAINGSIRERNASDEPHVLAMLGTRHKSGRQHFTAIVHERHLEVARRIKERGHVIDAGYLRVNMLRACKAAGVAPFMLGQLRHSVSTWLAQAGLPPDQVSRYLGHQSATTTRRHYIDAQTAALVLPRAALRVV